MMRAKAAAKAATGNFFEDFAVGQVIRHATPRTVTAGDVALYQALYGARFAVQSSDEFARALGLGAAPVDDWLVFHIVFGKTVPDISLNAVANLGYAEGVWGVPVFAGDTLSATSEVIGLRENSNGSTGTVYVRTRGTNQRGEEVLSYVRWVMVRKRDAVSPAPGPAPEPVMPDLAAAVAPSRLAARHVPGFGHFDDVLAGARARWGDYVPGEKIDHVDGMTVEEAEHQLATRLYQNTARVHFNRFTEKDGRFGRRLVYGGHVISLARALSFNGLEGAVRVVALNGGRHVAPLFAGDTVFAWSEVLETAELPGRPDAGLLRLRTVATKDRPCTDHPAADAEGAILDLDTWVALPR